VVTVTAHCPGATGNGEAWRHWLLCSGFSAARKVLPATSSLAARAIILPPATTSHLSVDGLYTCCSCTLRDDGDDFEAYSTAAIIDHLREHRAAGHHIPADLFDDLQTDATENDVWIRSGQGLQIMTTGADAPTC
jgi:hypothetical protein